MRFDKLYLVTRPGVCTVDAQEQRTRYRLSLELFLLYSFCIPTSEETKRGPAGRSERNPNETHCARRRTTDTRRVHGAENNQSIPNDGGS